MPSHHPSYTGSLHCILCGATDNLSEPTCTHKLDVAGYLRTLEGVKVGDLFIRQPVYRYGEQEVVKCTKITPKFADIGGHRYRIRDASGHGGGHWGRAPLLMPYDPEKATKLQAKAELRRQVAVLNTARWGDLPPDVVNQVYEIITAKKG